MATTAQWFAKAGGALIADLWTPRQMGIILMKPTFVPNIDVQMVYADVSAQELAAGGGYTVGGAQITNRSTLYNAGADRWDLLGDDVLWGPGASFSVRHGIVYEQATVDKRLWEILDFGQQYDVVNGFFTVDFSSAVLAVQAGPAV
jgi:hypothetical protein